MQEFGPDLWEDPDLKDAPLQTLDHKSIIKKLEQGDPWNLVPHLVSIAGIIVACLRTQITK